MGSPAPEDSCDLGGERKRGLEDVLNLDNWMLILLMDSKSIGHLHILERKLGLEKMNLRCL